MCFKNFLISCHNVSAPFLITKTQLKEIHKNIRFFGDDSLSTSGSPSIECKRKKSERSSLTNSMNQRIKSFNGKVQSNRNATALHKGKKQRKRNVFSSFHHQKLCATNIFIQPKSKISNRSSIAKKNVSAAAKVCVDCSL